MENKRNILLCVAGMSPQIITETLYYLTQVEKPAVRIDEIRVITTLDGKYKVMSTLLDKNKGEFFNFCRDYGIQPDSIKFDETCISLLQTKDKKVLKDIRTPEENELAGNQICEIIRELCKDENTRIFASAAGGRKTMSIYLTLAMSLFARAEDTLSHVLVSENFEGTDFFYPPRELKTIQIFNSQNGETKEISTADAKIYLAPIPFIRFRGIGSENQKFTEARSYGEIVEEAQKVLDIREKEYDLRINIKKQSVFVRGETVKLPKREFFFYLMFAPSFAS
jgi:CRISPR-associated protein (TIGR02584 family)